LEYWELLSAGIGTVEACRRVGVTRKTGYRWRAEMGGVSANKPAPQSDRYLSLFERQRIAALIDRDMGVNDIARAIGQSPSTVSRELRRNTREWDAGYEPVVAHVRARERAKTPKKGKIESSPWLHRFIQARPAGHGSPEQIHLHPRRRQRQPDRRTRRFVEAMRSIHDQPVEALDREEPGHWAGDLIVGAGNRSAIGTLVEQTTRVTRLVHLDGDHTAPTVTAAVVRTLRSIPEQIRRSLTWDQGSEMAEHPAIRQATGMDVFFCDPGSPWQRPSNENTNGLLRQHFPKGTDLSRHSAADLRRVEKELNNRPRKSLDGRTPTEVVAELSARLDPLRCDDR
jgi:IS30 family transposase